jgi:hypothetical protein
MVAGTLKQRVEALEAEVARLKARIAASEKTTDPWLEKVWGSFANDPIYDEAMRLGREWRESFRASRSSIEDKETM